MTYFSIIKKGKDYLCKWGLLARWEQKCYPEYPLWFFRENHLWYPSKETMGVESWPCFLLRSYFCGTWSVYSYLVTKDHPSLSARTLQTQQKLPMNLSPRDGGTDPRRKYLSNTIHPLSDINVHPQWTTDSEQKYSHNDGGHFVYQKYLPVIKHI